MTIRKLCLFFISVFLLLLGCNKNELPLSETDTRILNDAKIRFVVNFPTLVERDSLKLVYINYGKTGLYVKPMLNEYGEYDFIVRSSTNDRYVIGQYIRFDETRVPPELSREPTLFYFKTDRDDMRGASVTFLQDGNEVTTHFIPDTLQTLEVVNFSGLSMTINPPEIEGEFTFALDSSWNYTDHTFHLFIAKPSLKVSVVAYPKNRTKRGAVRRILGKNFWEWNYYTE